MNRLHDMRWIAYVWLLSLAAGCGGSVCSISGTVKLDGMPLEDGMIRFRPTGDTTGQGGQAVITNGAYAINADAGLSPGTYKVWIMAERKTGLKVRSRDFDPDNPGPLEDEVEQYIPTQYNVRTTLEATLQPGENQQDFKLEK